MHPVILFASKFVCSGMHFSRIIQRDQFQAGARGSKTMGEYNRRGFGRKARVKPLLQAAYASRVVDLLRVKGHQITRGAVTIRLAKEFGFCYGVERAVDMAYQTR